MNESWVTLSAMTHSYVSCRDMSHSYVSCSDIHMWVAVALSHSQCHDSFMCKLQRHNSVRVNCRDMTQWQWLVHMTQLLQLTYEWVMSHSQWLMSLQLTYVMTLQLTYEWVMSHSQCHDSFICELQGHASLTVTHTHDPAIAISQ